MIRLLALALLCSIALPCLALADSQATMDMTTTITPEAYAKLARQMGWDSSPDAMPTQLAPQTVTGQLYWNADQLRFDLVGNRMALPVSVIYDLPAGIVYHIDHSRNLAVVSDIEDLGAELGPLGMNLESPEGVLFNWEQLERLKGEPGVKYTDLGSQAIDGHACRGFHVSINIKQLLAAYPPHKDSLGLGVLLDYMDTFESTIWVANDLRMPLLMEVDILGMQVEMRIHSIRDFNAGESFYRAPANYRLIESTEPPPVAPPSEAQAA